MEQNEQEAVYQFSIFEKQVKEIQQQIDAVERSIIELGGLNLGLDELKGSTGKEILAPIGKGIFAKAELISEELNVDIGEGNIIKKSIPETKKLIEEQVKKLEQVREELGNNLEEIEEEMIKIIARIQERKKD
jgi:prefoldin alpha subunit